MEPHLQRPRCSSAATTSDADKRMHMSTGLTMSANGGWSHIISFFSPTERLRVTSLVSVAFLCAANGQPRSAKFTIAVLGGASAFSFNKVRAAHARFPALHGVRVALSNYTAALVPGLEQLLPELANFRSITVLTLHRQELTTLPRVLCALNCLETLNVSHNKLTSLPDAIGGLAALTSLDVGSNHLTVLPDTLGSLSRLTELIAYSNKLATLPDSIGSLTRLRRLILSTNKLASLPKAIGRCSSLQNAMFMSNHLTVLPPSMGALTALTRLNLGDNRIVALPDACKALTRLTTLVLTRNPLAKPQSAAVEAWCAALRIGAGRAAVAMSL